MFSQKENKGLIFDIQRFCVHDGPDIRTTVFFKGCPLNCLWCHNPEGISPRPEIGLKNNLCIGCGNCQRTCANKVHNFTDAGHLIDRKNCIGCGACVKSCIGKALSIAGKYVSADDALKEVLRDITFYKNSGGGMTVSGGEPLFQPAFLVELLQKAKSIGLNCCVETSGMAEQKIFTEILQYVDLFLYDFKETNDVLHKKYTGVSNKKIIENLRYIISNGARVRLRCPIIPGFNDRDDHFQGIAEIRRELNSLEEVELLPYNPLGLNKYERFEINLNHLEISKIPDGNNKKIWTEKLNNYIGGAS